MEQTQRQRFFEDDKELLVQGAREARKNACSYRGFKVGAAVLGKNSIGQIKMFLGCNMKPSKDGPTFCAEQGAVSTARANGYTEIIAICVVGQPQPEDDTPTLHPCWVCRSNFTKLPGVSGDTIILTVNNGHDNTREEHTFKEILDINRG